jgi:hypothetical protein
MTSLLVRESYSRTNFFLSKVQVLGARTKVWRDGWAVALRLRANATVVYTLYSSLSISLVWNASTLKRQQPVNSKIPRQRLISAKLLKSKFLAKVLFCRDYRLFFWEVMKGGYLAISLYQNWNFGSIKHLVIDYVILLFKGEPPRF